MEPSRQRSETRIAAKHMIELVVTAGQARRFAGETLYDGIDNELITIESNEQRF